MKLCIYSGTFNPIHSAHVRVAQGILEHLNLDKMIIIPNNIPPHKTNEAILNAKDRLKMLELAFDNPRFEINDIELKMGGTSYSLNTIKEIKKQYKIDERVNFLLGTDSFKTLKLWYHYEELVKLVNFIVVPREDVSDIDKIAQELDIEGLEYEAVNLPFVDISSTQIRNWAKKGEDLKTLLPEKVADYINENSLLRDFSFDEIKILLEQNFNANMKHCIGVSDMAVELAQKYGADPEKAKLAGILHDCVKYIPIEIVMELIGYNNIEVLPEELDAPRTLHGPVGAFVAQTYFRIDDKEILDAIRYHTIGREKMTTLDKCVFIADKIEPITRESDFIKEIEPALKKGLDSAILKYYELLIKKLENEGQKITPYTKGVIGYFKKIG